MVPPDTGRPRIIRSNASKLYFWIGIFFSALAVTCAVFIVVSAITEDYGQLGLLIALTPLFAIAGVMLCLIGRQMWARADPEGITWHTLLGRSTSVPWRAVHHVEVPPTGHRSKYVQLALPNGGRVDVKGIAKLPNPKGSDVADASYLTAGQEIVSAHQAWLARQR